jgi:AcrR family transcriptional regulator
MQQQHADFREAMRAKLGQALREQHDLTEPLPRGLVELLGQLDASVRARDTEARFYAEIDECVATMVRVANRKRGEPWEA